MAHGAGGGQGSVMILGTAYKGDIPVMQQSPAVPIIEELRQAGMRVEVHEPYGNAPVFPLLTCEGEVPWGCLADHAVVFLHTDHRLYADVPQATLLTHLRPGQKILDNTGCWAKHREAFAQRGVWYRVIGEPGWTGDRA